MTYWHRTCVHRAPLIEEAGFLRPAPQPVFDNIPMVWLTVSASAQRPALGLSSITIRCDRMAHLFRVIPEDEHLVRDWATARRALLAEGFTTTTLHRLEAVQGTKPILWAVALEAVRVERA